MHLSYSSSQITRVIKAAARTICTMQESSCKPLTRCITPRIRLMQLRDLKVHRQQLRRNKPWHPRCPASQILVSIRRRWNTHTQVCLFLSMERLLTTLPHQATPARPSKSDNPCTPWHLKLLNYPLPQRSHSIFLLSILPLSRAHILIITRPHTITRPHILTITRPHKAFIHLTPRARIRIMLLTPPPGPPLIPCTRRVSQYQPSML